MKKLLRLALLLVLLATNAPARADVYLAGGFSDWQNNMANYPFTDNGNGIYSMQIDGATIAGNQFKIVDDGTWYSYGYSVEVNAEDVALSSSDNSVFPDDLSGTYLLTYDATGDTKYFSIKKGITVQLVGDFAGETDDDTSHNWASGDTDYIFTSADDVNFYLTISSSNAGNSRDMKILVNGKWYGCSTNTFSVDDKYTFVSTVYTNSCISSSVLGKLQLHFNAASQELTISHVYDFYLTGNVNSWTTDSEGYKFSANDDDSYSLFFKGFEGEFKITNGSWDLSWGASDAGENVSLNASTTTWPTSSNNFYFSGDENSTYKITFLPTSFTAGTSASFTIAQVDNSTITIAPKVENATKEKQFPLEASEGYLDRWPAYFNAVNTIDLGFSLTNGIAGATYTIKVTADEESFTQELTADDNGEISGQSIYVPQASNYKAAIEKVVVDGSELESLAEDAEESGQLTFEDVTISSVDIHVISSTEIVAKFNIQGTNQDYNPHVTFAIGNAAVATEGFTEYGLEGYAHRDADAEYVLATNNWSEIAGQKGYLPLNIINVNSEEDITGTISVVYPFVYGENKLQKVEKTADATIKADAIQQAQTGVSNIAVDAQGAATYYNLQGIRVANPQAGQIYILRQGDKTLKVIK